MIRNIVVDSAVLSALCKPSPGPGPSAVIRWVRQCQQAGHLVYIPEIVDFELRRELVRSGKTSSVALLNGLQSSLIYVPLNTHSMLLAADLWAQARNSGYATTNPDKLDVDVILAAQALLLPTPPGSLIVATTNVRHLSRFVAADEWQNIKP